MKINKRLKEISKYVKDSSSVIDIGCDHALLDIFLYQNKQNIQIIASDINTGPLEQARKNLERFSLVDKITIKLGDGLDSIEYETDTIIISGMGGELMSQLFTKGKSKLKNIKTIILSPNNEFYILRKTLMNMNYYISDETIVKDHGKYYHIIVFNKGPVKYSEAELHFGPILLNEKPANFISFYEFILNTYTEILKKIPKNNTTKKLEIENYISKIKEVLK